MILNNYRALQYMREEIGNELSPAVVLELQRILTEGALDNPDAAGRLQTLDDDRVAVFSRDDGTSLHDPASADQLPERLAAICEFANGANDPDQFMQPLVRAVALHFWLAYDHPFEDGTGRAARALFYWSMRTHGYWLIAISKILRDAPAQYARSFRLTETDENDCTYFLLYQLGVIEGRPRTLRSTCAERQPKCAK
jgi:Fic family protein